MTLFYLKSECPFSTLTDPHPLQSPRTTLKFGPMSRKLKYPYRIVPEVFLVTIHPMTRRYLQFQGNLLVTLRMGSVSLKTNRLFGLSQQGIHANIVKFHLLDQQVLASSESSCSYKTRPRVYKSFFVLNSKSYSSD